MNPKIKLVNDLIAQLTNPNEHWVFNEYEAVLPRTTLRLWIANGWISFDINQLEMPLSLIDKWRIWRAVDIAKCFYVSRSMKATPTT